MNPVILASLITGGAGVVSMFISRPRTFASFLARAGITVIAVLLLAAVVAPSAVMAADEDAAGSASRAESASPAELTGSAYSSWPDVPRWEQQTWKRIGPDPAVAHEQMLWIADDNEAEPSWYVACKDALLEPVHWGTEDPGWSVERVVDALSRDHVSCWATRNPEATEWEIEDMDYINAMTSRNLRDEYAWECTYPKKRLPRNFPEDQRTRSLVGGTAKSPDKKMLEAFNYRKKDCTLTRSPGDPYTGDLPEDGLSHPAG